MATYYIDANAGDNKNDGLSENEAVADLEALFVKPGDTVLFKRGSCIRKKILQHPVMKRQQTLYLINPICAQLLSGVRRSCANREIFLITVSAHRQMKIKI